MSAGTYFGEMQAFRGHARRHDGLLEGAVLRVIVHVGLHLQGLHCGHGAEGVARATTEAVVLSSVLILVWDYFLGSVLP
jgi:phospholipid/cholesterol/gamma-HCH transport system permease protein